VPGGHINNCLLRAELLADLLAQGLRSATPLPCRTVPRNPDGLPARRAC
jgi:hypothetical protein